MGTLTKKEKIKRLKQLFTLDEVCEILGYETDAYAFTNEVLFELQVLEQENKEKFEKRMYEEALNNGNFEESILYNEKLPI